MRNKPVEMAVTFASLEEIMAWIDYAKSAGISPKQATLKLDGVVFGVPCEPNAAIDAMVAKAAAAIEQHLTADMMRQLFTDVAAAKGSQYVRELMGKHGGTRLADIAEDQWPALAKELRDA